MKGKNTLAELGKPKKYSAVDKSISISLTKDKKCSGMTARGD